jgi:hypothetical protein
LRDFELTRDSAILLSVANRGSAGMNIVVTRSGSPSSGSEVRGKKKLAGSNEQRAISIRQPWAYAILHLGKDVENRPMRTHYRGRILIQASLKVEEDEARELKLDPDELSTGAIVGSVEIVDCIRGSKSKWANRGQWYWVLKNPRVLAKPIPFKGALGCIRVPDRILRGARFRTPR